MRHRIRDLAQALHEPLDAVQHAVEIFRQGVELIMRARHRHPAGEIAGDDFARGPVDGIQPPQHVAAHQRPAEQAKHQDQRHGPGQGGGEHALGQVAVMHIFGDQQIEIAARRLQWEQSAASTAAVLNATQPPLIIEFDEIARIVGDGRPGIQVARQYPVLGIGQNIKLALAGMQRVIHHAFIQSANAQAQILLVEARDLGLDDLVSLGVEGAAGVPISEEQQCADRKGEKQHIDQHDAEGLGAKQSETGSRHRPPRLGIIAPGSYSPRREWCAAAACRNPCQSWRAGARYERQ